MELKAPILPKASRLLVPNQLSIVCRFNSNHSHHSSHPHNSQIHREEDYPMYGTESKYRGERTVAGEREDRRMRDQPKGTGPRGSHNNHSLPQGTVKGERTEGNKRPVYMHEFDSWSTPIKYSPGKTGEERGYDQGRGQEDERRQEVHRGVMRVDEGVCSQRSSSKKRAGGAEQDREISREEARVRRDTKMHGSEVNRMPTTDTEDLLRRARQTPHEFSSLVRCDAVGRKERVGESENWGMGYSRVEKAAGRARESRGGRIEEDNEMGLGKQYEVEEEEDGLERDNDMMCDVTYEIDDDKIVWSGVLGQTFDGQARKPERDDERRESVNVREVVKGKKSETKMGGRRPEVEEEEEGYREKSTQKKVSGASIGNSEYGGYRDRETVREDLRSTVRHGNKGLRVEQRDTRDSVSGDHMVVHVGNARKISSLSHRMSHENINSSIVRSHNRKMVGRQHFDESYSTSGNIRQSYGVFGGENPRSAQKMKDRSFSHHDEENQRERRNEVVSRSSSRRRIALPENITYSSSNASPKQRVIDLLQSINPDHIHIRYV